jgi:hypothetical protein
MGNLKSGFFIYSSRNEFIVTKLLGKIKTNIEKIEVKNCGINYVKLKNYHFQYKVYISCMSIILSSII